MFGDHLYRAVILCTLVNQFYCDDETFSKKLEEGVKITTGTAIVLYTMFMDCISEIMPNQHFIMDDPQRFVNYPARTTVGLPPKFTSNRKFFANMINTVAFKEMVAADEEKSRQDLIRKMKYCDNVIMDQDILIEMYDREVDQSNI